MKVALVTYAMNVGGLESVILSLAHGLRESGHEVSFVITEGVGAWHNRPSCEGFPVETVLPNRWESRQRHVRRVAHVLSLVDAVLLNHSAPAQCGTGLLPASTVALAVLHNDVSDIYRVGLANFENLDGVVAVGERVRAEAIARGVPAEQVFCIRNGVNVFTEYPKPNAPRIESHLRIIFLGRIFHEQKGVFYLPGVMSNLRNLGVRFRLDIVGDGPDREELASRFSASGISDSVHFHGAVPHDAAMGLLAEADVLVMPSHYEGQPVTLFEAMARGVVPVVSLLPGITDSVIQHDADGILVPVGDEAAFARELGRLTEPGLRYRISQAAWERARQEFSVEAMTQSYLTLLSACWNRRKAGHAPKRTNTLDIVLLGKRSGVPIVFHEVSAAVKSTIVKRAFHGN